MSTIRVLVADDQHLVRGALAALVGLEPDLDVVGEAATGEEALAAISRLAPDVALVDIEMPGVDGIGVAAQVRDAGSATRVLMLTTFGRPGYLRRAMEAGAWGFLVKDAPAPQLVAAIRRVHAGDRVVDPALAATSLSVGANPLTTREQDVLRTARGGATVADIAQKLFLSEGTVRNYLSSAIGKTGTRNRTEAVRAADAYGWL